MQAEANLPNVSFVDRVPEQNLETFLAAADVWVIPYRKDLAGVSVPSRFYNLLAMGRPVVLVSEPEAEAAQIVREHDIGWVVAPGNAEELASAISAAASSKDEARGARAADSLLFLSEAMIALKDNTRACRALAEFGAKYPSLATGRLQDQYDKDRKQAGCK